MTIYTPTLTDVSYRTGLNGVNSGKQYFNVYYPSTPAPAGGYPSVVWYNNVGLIASARGATIDSTAGLFSPFKAGAIDAGYVLFDVEVTVPVAAGDPVPGTPVGDGLIRDPADAEYNLDGGGDDTPVTDAIWVAQFLRYNAATYQINPNRMWGGGTSGGAIVAMWAGMGADAMDPTNSIPRRRVSSRFCGLMLFRVHGCFTGMCTDSAAGGPTAQMFRKASAPTTPATDLEDVVANHALHATPNWLMVQPGAFALNQRLPCFLSSDATPGIGEIGTPMIYTVNSVSHLHDDVATAVHGTGNDHDPWGQIVRIAALRQMDTWHNTHSKLVAKGTYTKGGITPDDVQATDALISTAGVTFMLAETPGNAVTPTAIGTGVRSVGHQWLDSSGAAPVYPTNGTGGSTEDAAASSLAGQMVIVDGLYVETAAGATPSVTIVDQFGADIRPSPLPPAAVAPVQYLSVQSGVVNYGALGFTASTTITAVDTTKTFPRLTGLRSSDAGRSTPDTVAQTNTGVGESIVLTDSTHIGHTQTTTADAGVDHRLAWETQEYKGPAGGVNEWIVRSVQDVTINDTSATTTTAAISAIVDYTKCVVYMLANRNNRGAAAWDSVSVTAVVNSGKTVTLTRGDTTGAAIYSIAVVEYTGTNWQVVTFSHTVATAGARESVSLSASIPSFAHAFIVGHYKIPSTAVANRNDGVLFLTPVSGTGTIDTYLATSGTTGGVTQGYVVYNPEINVTHAWDTTVGGALATFLNTDQVKTYTITAVDLATTSLLCYGSSTGATASIPAGCHMNYRFASTTSIECWRGRTSGNNVGLQFQIISMLNASSTYPTRAVGRYIKLGIGPIPGPVGLRTNETGTSAKMFYRVVG